VKAVNATGGLAAVYGTHLPLTRPITVSRLSLSLFHFRSHSSKDNEFSTKQVHSIPCTVTTQDDSNHLLSAFKVTDQNNGRICHFFKVIYRPNLHVQSSDLCKHGLWLQRRPGQGRCRYQMFARVAWWRPIRFRISRQLITDLYQLTVYSRFKNSVTE